MNTREREVFWVSHNALIAPSRVWSILVDAREKLKEGYDHDALVTYLMGTPHNLNDDQAIRVARFVVRTAQKTNGNPD